MEQTSEGGFSFYLDLSSALASISSELESSKTTTPSSSLESLLTSLSVWNQSSSIFSTQQQKHWADDGRVKYEKYLMGRHKAFLPKRSHKMFWACTHWKNSSELVRFYWCSLKKKDFGVRFSRLPISNFLSKCYPAPFAEALIFLYQ